METHSASATHVASDRPHEAESATESRHHGDRPERCTSGPRHDPPVATPCRSIRLREPPSRDEQLQRGHALASQLRRAAESGDGAAMVRLSRLLWWGYDADGGKPGALLEVTKDASESERWARRAAEIGEADGMCMVGLLVECHHGDLKGAVEWYRRAAVGGSARAMTNLGLCLVHGEGVKADVREGVSWFRRGVALDWPWSHTKLGDCYLYGRSVPNDFKEAVRCYRAGASGDDAVAMFALAWCLLWGKGAPRDVHEAVRLLHDAHELRNARSSAFLGMFYEEGLVVARDLARAVQLYELAASRDSWEGKAHLGRCLLLGLGTARDEVRGLALVEEASERRSPDVHLALGLCYEFGVGGKEVDAVRAVAEYRLAVAECVVGKIGAMKRLAVCLFHGRGCPQDRAAAMQLLEQLPQECVASPSRSEAYRQRGPGLGGAQDGGDAAGCRGSASPELHPVDATASPASSVPSSAPSSAPSPPSPWSDCGMAEAGVSELGSGECPRARALAREVAVAHARQLDMRAW